MADMDAPAIGISMSMQIDDHRNLVMQAPIEATCERADLDGLLDKLRDAAERQRALAHLPTYRGQLEEARSELERETANLFRIEAERGVMHSRWTNDWEASGKRREFSPTAGQKQEQARSDQEHGKSVQNITVLKKQIMVLERRVADYEAKAGVAAAEA